MKILLRDAIFSDFDTIARISLKAYQEYSTILEAQNWQKMQHSLSDVETTASTANFIVAEVENKIEALTIKFF